MSGPLWVILGGHAHFISFHCVSLSFGLDRCLAFRSCFETLGTVLLFSLCVAFVSFIVRTYSPFFSGSLMFGIAKTLFWFFVLSMFWNVLFAFYFAFRSFLVLP